MPVPVTAGGGRDDVMQQRLNAC